jgi:protein-disulfide isomerase
VTIVEFSDFECPFCARFYTDTLPELTKEYIDSGEIAFYYRHCPLSFHPQAVPSALASECANDQGKFWEMHDKIFDENNAGKLGSATDETYKGYAADLGLNADQFNSCFDDKTHQSKVDEDFAAGNEVGVSGTPTFYINGRQLVGAQPFTAFKAVIDEELKK